MKFRSHVLKKYAFIGAKENRKGDFIMIKADFIKRSSVVCVDRVRTGVRNLLLKGMKKEPGIDGILVTIGLCIIALLLCVVMKDSLQAFITTIVDAMKTEAQKILTGVAT